jgi:hypothetical protein
MVASLQPAASFSVQHGPLSGSASHFNPQFIASRTQPSSQESVQQWLKAPHAHSTIENCSLVALQPGPSFSEQQWVPSGSSQLAPQTEAIATQAGDHLSLQQVESASHTQNSTVGSEQPGFTLTSQQFDGPPELPPQVPQNRLDTSFTPIWSHPVLQQTLSLAHTQASTIGSLHPGSKRAASQQSLLGWGTGQNSPQLRAAKSPQA